MSTKTPIVYKAIKTNVKLIIDGETFSRKIEDVEERKLIKERVIAYNDKPLVKEKTALKKFMNAPKVEAKTEVVEKVTKTTKPKKKIQEVIDTPITLTEEEQIEAAKKLLVKKGYTVHAQPVQSTKRRSGEY